MVGLTDHEIADARRAHAATEKANAILKLARNIVMQRSEVTDAGTGFRPERRRDRRDRRQRRDKYLFELREPCCPHGGGIPEVKPGQIEARRKAYGIKGG